MTTERFQDDGAYLGEFRDFILVRCPRCEGQAVVLREEGGAHFSARFRCAPCGASAASAEREWAGPVHGLASGRCRKCGRRHVKPIDGPRRRARPVVRCGCGEVCRLDVSWSPRAAQGHDPYFGYPLWLVAEVGSHRLWAYNADHLRFLVRYVGATVRERQPMLNGTMASRLPKWLKAKENRARVMRALSRLEGRLGST